MRKYLKIRYLLLLLGVIILLFVARDLIINFTQKPVAMVEKESIWHDIEINNFKLTSNSIITWDNNKLKFYNFQGELIDEVIGNGYFTNVYFFDEEAVVLDKQLNVLYRYNSSGELKNKTKLNGSIYSVFKRGEDFYLHKKEIFDNQRKETLSKLEGDNKETLVYETDKFIVNFQIDGSTMIISEISSENYAYKSSLNIITRGNLEKFDFDNETVLDMRKIGKKIIAITNKNLYSIENARREKVELPRFKDYIFENNKIVILYDNKVSFFKNELDIDKTHEIGITCTQILNHNGSYFVSGPTDIIGFLGEHREFQKSFDSIVYGVDSNNKGLLVSHKYNIELYGFEEIKEGDTN